jgi:phosphate starvation-inducible PhoH-like protein
VNKHLQQIESFYDVNINCRSNQFEITGDGRILKTVKNAIMTLYNVAGHEELSPATVQLYLNDNIDDPVKVRVVRDEDDTEPFPRNSKHRRTISGRGKSQQQYLEQIKTNDLTIGVGPAGTGKTYLAVASAVEALESDLVDRLILVRPAVEAGERLGFLPGDLAQKIDPYLRPMYDALFEMMGQQKVAKCIERNIIEIAPLAYMRGRTLNDAFIILDEAQNTTIDQMKMFLTRIGFGSKAVVTGDITQVDLPREKTSGLRHALKVLSDIEGIGVTQFHKGDIVRHPLVKKIVHAYEEDESK